MSKVTVEKVVRETEKAYLVAVEVENGAGRRGKEVWWPKSQVKMHDGYMEVPEWLVEAKLNDMGARGAWMN